MGGTVFKALWESAWVGVVAKGVAVAMTLIVARVSLRHWERTREISEEAGGGDNVMRCLLSSLILSRRFRRSVLARGRDLLHAQTPETGLDGHLLFRAAERLARRQLRYDGALLAAAGALAAGIVMASPVMTALGFMAVASLAVIERYDERFNWMPLFHHDVFEPGPVWEKLGLAEEAAAAKREETVTWSSPEQSSSRRLVIYNGRRPFIGAGVSLGRWSLAVDTKRSARLFGQLGVPEPINARDVYAVAERALRGATSARVVVDDYLFVHGCDLRPGTWVLPSSFAAPLTEVPDTTMREINGSGEFNGRYYRWVRFIEASSDVVLSYLFRCSFHGVRTLAMEVEKFVLPPLAPRYQMVDRLPSLDGVSVILWGLAVVLASPFRVLRALREAAPVAGRTLLSLTKIDVLWQRRRVARELRHNYGSKASLREVVAANTLARFFQESDLTIRAEGAESAMFGALADFFEDKNIDAAILRSAQNAVQEAKASRRPVSVEEGRVRFFSQEPWEAREVG